MTTPSPRYSAQGGPATGGRVETTFSSYQTEERGRVGFRSLVLGYYLVFGNSFLVIQMLCSN